MAEVVGVDLGNLVREQSPRRDRRRLDLAAAELLDGRLSAVDARLNVELPGGGDEERHVARLDEVDDPLAHLVAGQVEVLPDVRESRVRRRVGVVAQHRDALAERVVRRAVEGLEVDERDQDARRLGRDRRVERVDHLADVRRLRAGPLVAAAEQRARVLRAVDRRHEERVRRHVVDEHELPLRMRLDEVVGGQRLRDGAERRAREHGGRHAQCCGAETNPLQQPAPVEDELLTFLTAHLLRRVGAEIFHIHDKPPFPRQTTERRDRNRL